MVAILFVMEMDPTQYLEKYLAYSLTQFGMPLYLYNFQAKFDYRDLDLIYKVVVAILFVVHMVFAQYLEK